MVFDSDSSILVIFCRRPSLGVGKQRIAAELGTQAALEAANLILDCALEDAQAWPGTVVLSPANPADRLWAEGLLPNGIVIAQSGGNLGERIAHVRSVISAAGAQNILFIGSDSPYLTDTNLADAAATLSIHDAVVISARDGGVTLLGSRLPWPDLSPLGWETHTLCKDLLNSCARNNLSTHVLDAGADIDTRADLLAAADWLAADTRVSRQKLFRWIEAQRLNQQLPTSVSIIIPVLNDHQALHEQLQRLAALQPSPQEIIVVDGNGANETCIDLCEHFGARHIPALANRGEQLRRGAAESCGEILWFLHADSSPETNAIAIIRQHICGNAPAGYFRFHFTGASSWHKRLLEQLINLRARIGVPYGDQGIFAERSAYFAAGQHAGSPLFEEVPLIKQLRRNGGCKPVAAPIGVSPRRWERDGWMRRSLLNRLLALAYILGVAPERLARQYHSHQADQKR